MDTKNDVLSTNSIPKWYWIVSGVMLLWNLMGLAAFCMTMSMIGNSEAMAAAGFSEAQQEVFDATPTWSNVAFAIAVIFGVLGCIALLMKKKLAIPLLVISLLGVLAQNTYFYFLSNSVEVMGVQLTPLVILISVLLVPFAIFCAGKGWLR